MLCFVYLYQRQSCHSAPRLRPLSLSLFHLLYQGCLPQHSFLYTVPRRNRHDVGSVSPQATGQHAPSSTHLCSTRSAHRHRETQNIKSTSIDKLQHTRPRSEAKDLDELGMELPTYVQRACNRIFICPLHFAFPLYSPPPRFHVV